MPEQVITIRTKTEVAALEKLERNLETQIVTAKALGKEYDHLEQSLVRTREAMARIPDVERSKADILNGLEQIPGIGGAMKIASGAGGAVTAALAAGNAFKNLAEQGFDAAKAVSAVSKETGVAVDNVQAFVGVLGDVGTDSVKSAAGLQKFNEKLGDAKIKGGETKAFFDKLGISIKDISTDEALVKTLDAIAGIGDESVRSKISVELFGDAGRRLSEAFKDGAESLKRFKQERDADIFSKDEIRNVETGDRLLGLIEGKLKVQSAKASVAALTLDIGKLFKILTTASQGGSSGAWLAGAFQRVKQTQDEIVNARKEESKVGDAIINQLENEAAIKRAMREDAEAEADARKSFSESENATKFRNIDEVIAAGKSGRPLSREQQQDVKRAELAKRYEDAAAQQRGFNPARAQELLHYAETIKGNISSLSDNAKTTSPLTKDKPQPTVPGSTGQGGIAGALETTIRQTMSVATPGGLNQLIDEMSKGNAKAIEALKNGVDIAKLSAAQVERIIQSQREVQKRLSVIEQKGKNTL